MSTGGLVQAARSPCISLPIVREQGQIFTHHSLCSLIMSIWLQFYYEKWPQLNHLIMFEVILIRIFHQINQNNHYHLEKAGS